MNEDEIKRNPILNKIRVFHIDDLLDRIVYDELIDDLFHTTFGDEKHYKKIEIGYNFMLGDKTVEVVDIKFIYLSREC